jgi:hypothetical protein
MIIRNWDGCLYQITNYISFFTMKFINLLYAANYSHKNNNQNKKVGLTNIINYILYFFFFEPPLKPTSKHQIVFFIWILHNFCLLLSRHKFHAIYHKYYHTIIYLHVYFFISWQFHPFTIMAHETKYFYPILIIL